MGAKTIDVKIKFNDMEAQIINPKLNSTIKQQEAEAKKKLKEATKQLEAVRGIKNPYNE